MMKCKYCGKEIIAYLQGLPQKRVWNHKRGTVKPWPMRSANTPTPHKAEPLKEASEMNCDICYKPLCLDDGRKTVVVFVHRGKGVVDSQLEKEKELSGHTVCIEKMEFRRPVDVEGLKNAIREMPNRDDQLYAKFGKKTLSVATLDGGGVGRFDVLKKIDEVLK